eukprot:gene9085-10355_t
MKASFQLVMTRQRECVLDLADDLVAVYAGTAFRMENIATANPGVGMHVADSLLRNMIAAANEMKRPLPECLVTAFFCHLLDVIASHPNVVLVTKILDNCYDQLLRSCVHVSCDSKGSFAEDATAEAGKRKRKSRNLQLDIGRVCLHSFNVASNDSTSSKRRAWLYGIHNRKDIKILGQNCCLLMVLDVSKDPC